MLNISGGNLAIGISLLMRDGFSGPAATATASMAAMQRQTIALARAQMTMARNSNLLGAAIGIGVISRMGAWVKEGAKYGYTMQYVASLTRGTADEIARLDKRGKSLGQSTMFSSQEVASGMRYMAMAGMDTEEIYQNIGAAVDLGVATLHQLGGKGGAADIITNIMKGFQISAEHAVRVADVLTTATTSANISIFDLGESMKYAAATSMDLGIGLEEVAAMAMMAGNAGIQGAMAGTATENMLRYITMATSGDRRKATKALADLGLDAGSLKDAHGNLKSIGAIMHTIAAQVEKIDPGTAQAQNWYIRLFGVRGKRQASLMLRNMKDYDRFLNKLNLDSPGAARRVSGMQMETLEGRMKQWSDTLKNLKIAYTEALEPLLKPLIYGLTKIAQLIKYMTETKIGKLLTIIASGFVVLKTLSFIFKTVMLSINLITGNFGSIVTASTGRATAGWNSATSAARRYRMTAAGASMAGGMGMGMTGMGGYTRAGKMYRGPSGMFMARGDWHKGKYGAAGKYTAMGPKTGGKGMMGMMGGKGFGIGLLASIGLGMASSAAGTETTGGKVLSGVSDAASYGMMGAMVGSMFAPGIGTAIGAVVGAVGGALWNIYNQTKDVEDSVKAVGTDIGGPKFTKDTWATILEINKATQTSLLNAMQIREQEQKDRSWKLDEDRSFTSHIIINLDGIPIYENDIQDSRFSADVDLGMN